MKGSYRIEKILKIIPKDVKTVLDIGSAGNIFNKKYITTTVDILEEADYRIDLNKNQKLPFKSKSFDIVVLNQVLEHLPTVEEIIKESKRVSKKYIFIGLPNELIWNFRIKFLIGSPPWKGYRPYWHKHFFTVDTIEEFIKKFFKKEKIIKKEFLGAFLGASLLPWKIRDFLARNFPSFFAKEIYYIIKLR